MAKIPYTLIHEHRHGIDIFNFVSEKEFSSEFRYDDEAIKNKSLLKNWVLSLNMIEMKNSIL